MVDENAIARRIVDTAYPIHVDLGPGLLESVYESVLANERSNLGLQVGRQVRVPVIYKQMRFDEGFRADLIVHNAVIVELKSVARIEAVYSKQLLTYLRLADKRLGLLINFGETLFKNGVKRIVNRLPEA